MNWLIFQKTTGSSLRSNICAKTVLFGLLGKIFQNTVVVETKQELGSTAKKNSGLVNFRLATLL